MPQQFGAGTASVVAPGRSSKWLAISVALVLAVGVLTVNLRTARAATQIDLGTAESFAVLAGQGVTNVPAVGTVINGDLGTDPNPAVTGFPPGVVNGTIHQANGVSLQAQADLVAAYNDAAGQGPVTTIATELGGETLTPGVYDSLSGTFQITGTLTLDGEGDPDAVFIFQTASTLVTAPGAAVAFIGTAQACNTYWQVGSSATLDTNTDFAGNILALTSIQALTGATVEGRLLARNASVTLDDNTITAATCATTPPPSSPPGPTTPPGGTGTPSQIVRVPSGGPQTGEGSTSGGNLGMMAIGGVLLVVAAATFAIRRRSIRHG